ncbi:MAG: ABC transporter permease [Gemmatimonadetes bacterium]|nr:ABC transporter permease [Gemmatimonadota bacterium]
MLADLWRDVRLALRGLRSAPVFTLVAVLTLAVGIGANTAVFSVLHALVLAPLPYPHLDRLVAIRKELVKRGIPFYLANPADLIDYRGAKGFQEVEAVPGGTLDLTNGAEPERISYGLATPGLFAMLGATPVLGRAFTKAEGVPPAPSQRASYSAPVVLSYEFWTRRFGADPNIIGRTLHFEYSARGPTVVGVLPKGFRVVTSGQSELATDHPDVWFVWLIDPTSPRRTGYDLYTLGKLKPGVTIAQANKQIGAISTGSRSTSPSTRPGARGRTWFRSRRTPAPGCAPCSSRSWERLPSSSSSRA